MNRPILVFKKHKTNFLNGKKTIYRKKDKISHRLHLITSAKSSNNNSKKKPSKKKIN